MNEDKHKILLVEDDKFLATALGDKLEREGFQVARATTGVAALEAARASRPDLVLLDLIIPQKSGFQVLTELKADAALASIPVIILSNLGQEADIEKAKALGAADYFIKSDVQMKEVVARIKTYLA